MPAPKPLSLRALGEIELRRGGRLRTLPQSKRARALLADLISP